MPPDNIVVRRHACMSVPCITLIREHTLVPRCSACAYGHGFRNLPERINNPLMFWVCIEDRIQRFHLGNIESGHAEDEDEVLVRQEVATSIHTVIQLYQAVFQVFDIRALDCL